MRAIPLYFLAVAMILVANPARAVVAYIDNFSVVKNGNLFFQDAFTDAAEPPSAPTFPNGQTATYTVLGTFQSDSEASGKLRLNSTDGATIVGANGFTFSSLTALLNSDVNPDNLINGLKIDDTFSMTGTFDLVLNSGPLYSAYGITFTDGTALLARRNELVLQVQYSEILGMNVIRLAYQDFDAGTTTTVALLPLDAPAGADQIALTLTRGDLNSLDLLATYSYLDGGQVVQSGSVGTTSIFQDRNFVRGLFFAASVQAVPEPGTLALLGIGLAGLAFTRRRTH